MEERIVATYRAGNRQRETARICGVSPATVARILKKHQVEPHPSKYTTPASRTVDGKEERRCPRCSEWKTTDGFYKSNGSKTGYTTYCVECFKTYQADERKAASRKRRRGIRLEMVAAYGGLCACCGESRWEFLTIDHIGGGGNKHRKEVGSGSKFYRWLKERGWPQIGYRLLCFNCNAAHGLLGYCPHQSEIKRG